MNQNRPEATRMVHCTMRVRRRKRTVGDVQQRVMARPHELSPEPRMRSFASMIAAALAALAVAAAPAAAEAPATAADSAAIRALVLDYALGWYDGEPARMERALHPQLAKRSIARDSRGRQRLAEMTVERLMDEARSGVGRQVPANVRRIDVRILDVYGDIASVRGDMHGWVDYFQVARMNGKWKVVNVLWALRPRYGAAPRRVRPAMATVEGTAPAARP